ncbi:MAG: cytochrome c-type biogenesis CcmF C-terminal domain-containing protein, partial [Arenicellales bacterium]
IFNVSRSFWGMSLGHIGIAVFIVGITLTSIYSTEKDLQVNPGESYELAGFNFTFVGVEDIVGKNYRAANGKLTVSKNGTHIATMEPEKREYLVQKMPMTEAAIDAGLFRDLFVALGEPLGDDGAWSVRIYHKPFIRWIWLGALIMALGGLLSATDPRYRKLARAKQKQAAVAAEALA